MRLYTTAYIVYIGYKLQYDYSWYNYVVYTCMYSIFYTSYTV